ncbi:MAG: lytic transglycosylase domain-containing protein [Betaproteobacteria bacterium]
MLAVCATAHAGAQQYEQLADNVRSAMSAAISDQSAPLLLFKDPEAARTWLNEMSARLARRIPDRKVRTELLKTVHHESMRAGLDPQLVLGLMEVESAFRKYAVSSAGARGYMQVMPFWVKLIGRPDHNLFHARLNVRYGCIILRHYLDIEHGDYFRALGRYNGSLGKPEYPNLVLGAWKGKWGFAGATS